MPRLLRSALLAALSIGMVLAQKPAFPPAPRAADGHPDLTGVWQGNTNRPGSWEEANTGFGVGQTGDPAPSQTQRPSQQPLPPRDPPPYQPWAAAKVLESFNRRGIDDPAARCLAGGVPRANLTGLFPIQIVQTPQQIVILYEYMRIFRVIPLNAKHPYDLEPTYMGDSVGHWEGNTLVVDVTGFNGKTWLGPTGTFHTEALHVTERYTRVNRDTIDYDVTMEDPNVFTKPWTIHTNMMLRQGTRLREYECGENNEDVKEYEKLLKDESVFRRK